MAPLAFTMLAAGARQTGVVSWRIPVFCFTGGAIFVPDHGRPRVRNFIMVGIPGTIMT